VGFGGLALLGLWCVGLCVGTNPNVPNALGQKFFPVRWAFFIFSRVGLCRLVKCLPVG